MCRRLLWLHLRWERASELSQRNGDARGKTWLHRISRAVEEVCVRAGVCGEGSRDGGREGGGNCQDLVDRCSRWCRRLFSFIGSSSGSQATTTTPPPTCAMAAFTASFLLFIGVFSKARLFLFLFLFFFLAFDSDTGPPASRRSISTGFHLCPPAVFFLRRRRRRRRVFRRLFFLSGECCNQFPGKNSLPSFVSFGYAISDIC